MTNNFDTQPQPLTDGTNLLISSHGCFCHEQWFELRRFSDDKEDKVIRVVNSYGRVRDLYADGGYKDIHDGGAKND